MTRDTRGQESGARSAGALGVGVRRAWYAADRAAFRWIDGRYLRPQRYLTGPPGMRRPDRRIRDLRIPGVEPSISRDGRPHFRIPLAAITSAFGFSFAPTGWHPYVETLRVGAVPEPEMPLVRFYDRFTPRTVQEALLDDYDEPLEPLQGWPISSGLFSVWGLTHDSVARALERARVAEDRPRQFVGPHPQPHIREDIVRLRAVRDSIADRGYRPSDFGAGPISGYFLVRDSNFRFVCRHGHHRLAALVDLGFEQVDVTISPKVPPLVSQPDLEWWTRSRGGLYPTEVAHLLFRTQFEEEGRNKAARFGFE